MLSFIAQLVSSNEHEQRGATDEDVRRAIEQAEQEWGR